MQGQRGCRERDGQEVSHLQRKQYIQYQQYQQYPPLLDKSCVEDCRSVKNIYDYSSMIYYSYTLWRKTMQITVAGTAWVQQYIESSCGAGNIHLQWRLLGMYTVAAQVVMNEQIQCRTPNKEQANKKARLRLRETNEVRESCSCRKYEPSLK